MRRALEASCVIIAACAKVSSSESVDRMGMPWELTMSVPITPLWELIRFSVSSTSAMS
eukprot:CAMPEP_0206041346 /NCGR_PEP_ID=MMETSP1466-20131121/5919_1 /ASSEMBLY_ACC=CAM_ASM_001126 /TAXON_ID=44452 /ORGANISM="Pavlova gyrans, Strain CCMP608" /LENGTH=57 /DNA_ID=CAMNT_0053416041 /DNA_START=556 /DNA_END=729 /DNA_ORIENTATION=-